MNRLMGLAHADKANVDLPRADTAVVEEALARIRRRPGWRAYVSSGTTETIHVIVSRPYRPGAAGVEGMLQRLLGVVHVSEKRAFRAARRTLVAMGWRVEVGPTDRDGFFNVRMTMPGSGS